MSDDNPFSSPREIGGPASKAESGSLGYFVIRPLYDVAGWLRFLGVLNIVLGVLYCLTIIGAVIGWVPIWIGVLLNRSSRLLRSGYEDNNAQDVHGGLDQLALSIRIIGVVTVIGVVLNVLYLAAFLIVPLVMWASFPS